MICQRLVGSTSILLQNWNSLRPGQVVNQGCNIIKVCLAWLVTEMKSHRPCIKGQLLHNTCSAHPSHHNTVHSTNQNNTIYTIQETVLCKIMLRAWYGSGGVETNRPNLPVVYEDADSLISGATVVGGGEDSKQATILLEL